MPWRMTTSRFAVVHSCSSKKARSSELRQVTRDERRHDSFSQSRMSQPCTSREPTHSLSPPAGGAAPVAHRQVLSPGAMLGLELDVLERLDAVKRRDGRHAPRQKLSVRYRLV